MNCRLPLFALLALLGASSSALAQDPQPAAAPALADLVPRDTILLASFPRPSALRAAIDRIPVFQIAREPEVQQFYKSYQQHAAKLLDDLFALTAGDYYERLQELDRTFDRQMAIALMDQPGERGIGPEFVLLLDSSGPADKVRAFADAIGKSFASRLFEGEPKREHVGDADITMLSGLETDLAYAVRGSTLFAASNQAALTRALSAAPEATLGSDATFRAAQAKVRSSEPLFFAYINTRRAQELTVNDDPTMARANDIIGTSGVHGIAFELGFENGELRDRLFVAMPDGPKGLFRGLSVNGVHPENAKLAPAEAFALFSLALKPAEIYRTFAQLTREQGSPLRDVIGEPLDRIEQEIGLKLGKDFVELLGGEMTLSVSLPSGAALFPNVVLTADLRDATAFEKSLTELARKSLAIELREMDFLGYKIHYQASSDRSSPLVFSFAIAGDTLLTSYLPLVVKGALSRMKSGDAGLFGQDDYQQALKKVGDCNAVAYLNTARLFTYLYGLIVPLTQMMVPASEMPFDPATLPTAECIAKHLKFTVSGVHGQKDGIFIDSVSEGVGPASFAAYGTVLMVASAPALMHSEARDRRSECNWHLQSVALNLRLNENGEYQDRYPTAEEFTQRRNADSPQNDPGLWRCPSDHGAAQQEATYSSYEYFFATHPTATPPSTETHDVILMYDRAPRHFGGRNVVMADGRIEWLAEAEFAKRLTSQAQSAPAKESAK